MHRIRSEAVGRVGFLLYYFLHSQLKTNPVRILNVRCFGRGSRLAICRLLAFSLLPVTSVRTVGVFPFSRSCEACAPPFFNLWTWNSTVNEVH